MKSLCLNFKHVNIVRNIVRKILIIRVTKFAIKCLLSNQKNNNCAASFLFDMGLFLTLV